MGWLRSLEERVRSSPPRPLRRRPGDARAAVLVPLILARGRGPEPARPQDVEILLVRRSTELARHPGQIAFPGGRIEPSDRDSIEAALREAEEETGLPARAVRSLGLLADQRTPTGWVITPVLAEISDPGMLRPCASEIVELLRLPVGALLEPRAFRRVTRSTRDLLVHGDALVWGGGVVWGATARILLALRRLLLGALEDAG